MACMKFTLHGRYDSATEEARRILDNLHISYRFELCSKEHYEEPVLVTPVGRLVGLSAIEFMLGKADSSKNKRVA